VILRLEEPMRRRAFITLLGGAAAVGSSVSWPLVAQEQPGRMRRIGMLWIIAEIDPQATKNREAFLKQRHQLGWRAGDNVHIDHRSAADDANRQRAYAAELIGLSPDLIVAEGTPGLAAVRQATRTIPIIFANVTDPVGQGFVESLAHPGGNATGFSLYESSMGGKWLEILRELVPSVKKVELMFNPAMAPYSGLYFRSIQDAAVKAGIEPHAMPIDNESGLEGALSALGQQPESGLIVLLDAFTLRHRDLIIQRVARYRIPAIYTIRQFTESGGLISYGVDFVNQYRQAAVYADRILKGAEPADLPVQAPTKFELVVNLKTAKSLGLTVPLIVQMTADEVIE
jgi:putative tryptophan/tyrosine transport system substrate-binding protein